MYAQSISSGNSDILQLCREFCIIGAASRDPITYAQVAASKIRDISTSNNTHFSVYTCHCEEMIYMKPVPDPRVDLQGSIHWGGGAGGKLPPPKLGH